MKAEPKRVERFTLPCSPRGRELAQTLVATMIASQRTATLSEEIIECPEFGLTFRVLVVEAGPRPMEGTIAKEMKRLNGIANLNHR